MTSAVMEGTELRSTPHLAGLPLTPVERRVIALTAAGRTLAQIEAELGMSTASVRRNRVRIFEKLGASTAPQAVAIWLGREALRVLELH